VEVRRRWYCKLLSYLHCISDVSDVLAVWVSAAEHHSRGARVKCHDCGVDDNGEWRDEHRQMSRR
jgi:hypothetical protein